MPLDADAVHGALVRALQEASPLDAEGDPLGPRQVQGLAYHLSEWLDDLEAFHAFAREPEQLTPAQVVELLRGFLARVPAHLGEAQRIWER